MGSPEGKVGAEVQGLPVPGRSWSRHLLDESLEVIKHVYLLLP